jgi:hypothetical protein
VSSVVRLIALVGGIVVAPGVAWGQALPGRFEVAVGARWTGGAAFDSRDAVESTSDGGRYVLFTSSSELGASTAPEVRVGVRLTPVLNVEAAFYFDKADLETRLASDVENIPDFTARESVSQAVFEAGLTAQLPRWTLGSATPFISGGAGFIRELHENDYIAESGAVYYVGGGLTAVLRQTTGLIKALGVRGDVRATVRSGGVAFDDAATVAPALGISFFTRF